MGVQTYEPGHSRMYTITRCIGRYVKTSDYVALEQENAVLKARLERLSAPVSDEEWTRIECPDGVAYQGEVNDLIAARLSAPQKESSDAK